MKRKKLNKLLDALKRDKPHLYYVLISQFYIVSKRVCDMNNIELTPEYNAENVALTKSKSIEKARSHKKEFVDNIINDISSMFSRGDGI